MKQKITDFAVDVGKTLLIGFAVGLALGGIVFFVAFVITGNTSRSWDVCKNALSIATALLLFLVAGMLISKGKKTERFHAKDSWRRHFRVLGYKSVMGLFGVPMVILLSLADLLAKR